jgi:hypothetical protein
MEADAVCGQMIRAAELYNARALAKGWASYCDSSLSFHHAPFHSLVGIWHEARGDALIPSRQAMTARRLKDFLPDLALYERLETEGGHRHRCRLMGMRVARFYGDHTGKVVQEFMPPQNVVRFCAGIDDTMDACVPLRFLARTDSANTDFLSAEYCLLPLTGAEGRASMVMIAVSFSAVPWESFIAQMQQQLNAAQAKSPASAIRVCEPITAM